jgi:hypothetical protein
MSTERMHRRQWLGACSALLAGGLLPAPASASGKRSRVVLIRDRDVIDARGKLRAEVLERMLDRGVTRLLGVKDAAKAWKRLLRPADVVGIKTNVWRHLPTPPALNAALRRRVIRAGVKPGNVAVDDRGVLHNGVFKRATALLNVRPMRTHHWAGVGSLIKNYIMFVPRPYEYHDDACANLGAIWNLPHVKGKTRLNILVMLTPLFYGVGPHHYDPKYVWRYNGLLLGTDPVAVDATGLRIIMAKRRAHFGEKRRMRPPAKHIAVAGRRHGLGRSDPDEIELIKLGWSKDRLI